MKVFIFTAFDPLPIDTGYEPIRYWYLANALVASGHSVRLIAPSFFHQTKAQRQPLFSVVNGIEVQLLPVQGYKYGLSRLKFNKQIGKALGSYFINITDYPELFIIANPPVYSASVCLTWCSQNSIISVLDTQDLWPEAFLRKLPKLSHFLFNTWQKQAQENLEMASYLSGVSLGYKRAKERPFRVFPIGINAAMFKNELIPVSDRIIILGQNALDNNDGLMQIIINKVDVDIKFEFIGVKMSKFFKKSIQKDVADGRISVIDWLSERQLVARIQHYARLAIILVPSGSHIMLPRRLQMALGCGIATITNVNSPEVHQIVGQDGALKYLDAVQMAEWVAEVEQNWYYFNDANRQDKAKIYQALYSADSIYANFAKWLETIVSS
ncbi:MAG: hypothetical protein SGJ04_02170 [Bacteroidota bacterium]|nr:hypothetical protein [Bacteroidota bacterium]